MVAGSVATEAAVLSAEDVEQYTEFGYVVVKNVISREEASRYYSLVLDLLPRSLVFPTQWHVADGRIKPYREDGEGTWDTPELLPLMCHETLYRVASQLLGSHRLRSGDGRYRDGSLGITLRNDAGPVLSQRLHVDASIPRDADRALLIPEEVQVGGCYYFNDVEPEGGGIHVIPRGHRLVSEKVSNHPDGWKSAYQPGFFDEFPPSVEITARAGDFVLLHHLVPHAASNNRRSLPRVAQFVRFLRADNPHYPAQPAPPNLYNTQQLKAMGELGKKLLGVEPW
ncbi:MAG TPA: phytanoyl-CoA dioxygenase family protein [Acidimicrobiales bacterium]|nr:phytanoyl-CoA dioxygenase family protein [Acidimicrobiales bacterium]